MRAKPETLIYGLFVLVVLWWVVGDNTVTKRHGQWAFGVSDRTTTEPQRIIFTGDIFLGRAVERAWQNEGIAPFARITDFLQQGSAVVGNFESALPPQHVPTPDFGWQFSVATSAIPLLQDAGFTHLSLANNHSYDYGAEAFAFAVDTLNEAGMRAFGRPGSLSDDSYVIVPLESAVVGIIGIEALDVLPETAVLAASLDQLGAVSDIQVAYVHWGTEYADTANQLQTSLAKQLAELGVDIIVGHHPHVVQDIQMIEDTLVIYSLGNFVFDQYFSPEVQTGLVVDLAVSAQTMQIGLHPVSSVGFRHQPARLEGDERHVYLQTIAERSATSLQSAIESGVIELAIAP